MKVKEVERINIRLSPKLKQSFAEICEEREVSLSDAIRDLVSTYVKNYSRKNVKGKDND